MSHMNPFSICNIFQPKTKTKPIPRHRVTASHSWEEPFWWRSKRHLLCIFILLPHLSCICGSLYLSPRCFIFASSLPYIDSRCGILLSSRSFSFFSLFVILNSFSAGKFYFLCAQFNWSSKVSKDVKTDLCWISIQWKRKHGCKG